MKTQTLPRPIFLIAAALIACSSPLIHASPDAASHLRVFPVGQRGDFYLVREELWSQPGSYYSETEQVSYVVRKKGDNEEVRRELVRLVHYLRGNDGILRIDSVDVDRDIPEDLRNWDPITPYDNGSDLIFGVLDDRLSVGREDPELLNTPSVILYETDLPPGLYASWGYFQVPGNLEIFCGPEYYYLKITDGPDAGYDIGSTSMILPVSRAAVLEGEPRMYVEQSGK